MSTSGVLRLVALVLAGAVAGVTTAIIGVDLGLDLEGGARFVYALRVPEGADEDRLAAQARDVIASRIDAVGLRDVSLYARGGQIVLEVPGLDAQTFEILRSTVPRSAHLEIAAVDDAAADPIDRPPSDPRDRESLAAAIAGLTPPGGRRFVIGQDEYGAWRTYVLETEGALEGHIQDAEVIIDELSGRPDVTVRYDSEGARIFADLTRRQVRRRVAIVLDGEVLMAPMVQEPITGGAVRITLGGTDRDSAQLHAEASSLVAALRAGALPAPIDLESQSLIAPSIDAPARLHAVLGAVGVWIVLVTGAAIRLRVGGALWVLLAAPITMMIAMALTAALGGVVTITYCEGGAAGLLLTIAAGAAHLELVRRGRTSRAGWVGMAAMVGVGLLSALALFSLSTGPWRGFAAGLLLTMAAAPFACGLGATALERLIGISK
ncbi:MAG: hypothetical protein K8H88_20965 [Sandaracinaceae bacterium]|nr:hypothetical protein [Sandaracinaceae bacterium]